jgi:hypothetical protein
MVGGKKMISLKTNKVSWFSLRLATVIFVFLFGSALSIKAQTTADFEKLVKSLSDGKLKVETQAAPYYLVGDFNGDKIEDAAVIVSLIDKVENVGKVVKIEYPYAQAWGKKVKADDLALFIIHGKGKGWQSEQKSSVLMLGENSVLIFQKSRLGSDLVKAMEIEKDKRGKVSIVLITEASEGILKWNGKKYTWRETEP